MNSAIDTNVLLDVLDGDPDHGARSAEKLDEFSQAGPLIVAEAVFAELSSRRAPAEDLNQLLQRLSVSVQRSSLRALGLAGEAWAEYARGRPRGLSCAGCGVVNLPACQACSRPLTSRQHVLTDFLIGAHATLHADRLITRDRGIYARYFPQLQLA